MTATAGSVRWPTGTDYARVVQHAQSAFGDAGLQQAMAATNAMGMPLVASGQSAVVFLMRTANGEQAVRCFTTPPHEGSIRYDALSTHLATVAPTAITASRWLEQGVAVDGNWWPVVVMPWVDGQPFNLFVEDLLGDSDGLRRLADAWVAMVVRLQEADVTHGDLQHGNVLVRSTGELCLVDLDGAWVPTMTVGAPGESGHPNYQHPRRTPAQWGRYGDSFPALVVETGLRALAADPSLERFLSGENVLFSRQDLLDTDSELWRAVLASPDPDVVRLATVLADRTRGHPDASMSPYADLRAGDTAAPSLPRIDLGAPAVASGVPTLPTAVGTNGSGGDWWATSAGTAARPAAPAVAAAPAATIAPPPPGGGGQGFQPSPAAAPGPEERRSFGARVGREAAVGGMLAGAIAALIGSFVAGLLGRGLPGKAVPAVLVAAVAVLFGAFVVSWQAIAAGTRAAAARRAAIGGSIGAAAGLLSLAPATAIYNGAKTVVGEELRSDGLTYSIYDVPAIRSAFAWMCIALLIGLGIGALNGARTAVAGAVGGAVAGFLGGWVFGAHVAEFDGHLLLVDGSDPTTLLVVMMIGAVMGLAIGLTTKTASKGRLVIVEGRHSGMQTLVPARRCSIGSGSRNTLVLPDSSVSKRHVEIDLTGREPRLVVVDEVNGVRVNGIARHDGPLRDGDVLSIGRSFVRFDWKAHPKP